MASVNNVCSQGVYSYLAEQHNYFRRDKLSKSLLIGSLASVSLFGVGKALNIDLSYGVFLPFVFITAFGMGEGLMLQNKNDLEHKEAFDFMCEEKEGEEDEGN